MEICRSFQSNMLNYKIVLVLAVVVNTLAKPLSSEPARCCFGKKYSSKSISISIMYLPSANGTVAAAYTVSISIVI